MPQAPRGSAVCRCPQCHQATREAINETSEQLPFNGKDCKLRNQLTPGGACPRLRYLLAVMGGVGATLAREVIKEVGLCGRILPEDIQQDEFAEALQRGPEWFLARAAKDGTSLVRGNMKNR